MSYMPKVILVWDLTLELFWNNNPRRGEGLFSQSVVLNPGGMLVSPEGLLKIPVSRSTPKNFLFHWCMEEPRHWSVLKATLIILMDNHGWTLHFWRPGHLAKGTGKMMKGSIWTPKEKEKWWRTLYGAIAVTPSHPWAWNDEQWHYFFPIKDGQLIWQYEAPIAKESISRTDDRS